MLAGRPACPVAVCPQGSQAGSLRTAVGRQVDLTHQGFLPQLAALGSREGPGLPARPILPPIEAGKEDLLQTGSSFWSSSRGIQTRGASVSMSHTYWVFTHSPLVSQKRSRKDSRKSLGPKCTPHQLL